MRLRANRKSTFYMVWFEGISSLPIHTQCLTRKRDACLTHPKTGKNQRRFTESKALPDLQPLHVVDPIRWSGLGFRHDLMTLLARFGKPHHPDPKKTAKKGMNFVNPGKIQIFGRFLFELLVFFGSDLDFHPMLSIRSSKFPTVVMRLLTWLTDPATDWWRPAAH